METQMMRRMRMVVVTMVRAMMSGVAAMFCGGWKA